jgi:alkylation response protein AidB-like acyl-CoA dehydrogenase
MDVRLSPEQQALRDSAAQIVDRLGPRAVRELDDDERVAKLDAAVDAAGWRELRAAGAGHAPLASGIEAAIVAEELGRALGDVAFLGPTLAAELRRLVGAPSATSRETVALVPDLSALASVGGGNGGGAGTGAVAVDARSATAALVLVAVPAGHAVAGAPLPAASKGVDLTRPGVTVEAAEAAAPVAGADRPLGPSELDAWSALGLALSCADLVGTMTGAVRLACDYAQARRQYGAAIGSFQAVQHMLADAVVATEGSRSAALHAAWAVDALDPAEALAAASVAKAYCSRAARRVCETAIQVHGGIGNTWDCLAHVYLRRALLSVDILGGVGPSLGRVLAHNGLGGGSGAARPSGGGSGAPRPSGGGSGAPRPSGGGSGAHGLR